jgi:hypothetical protein
MPKTARNDGLLDSISKLNMYIKVSFLISRGTKPKAVKGESRI